MMDAGSRRARPTTSVGRWAPEATGFAVALAVAFVHVLDDAFLHREPGVGAGQHLLAVVVSLIPGLGAVRVLRVPTPRRSNHTR